MRHLPFYSLFLLTFAIHITPVSAQPVDINGNDVVVNGESFFAASNICSELTRLARRDGYIGGNESFRQIAMSGYSISQILELYNNCNPKPKYLITDGGGIDMMDFAGTCGTNPTKDCTIIRNALNTMQQYITKMRESGTKKFLYMRYPDPLGSQYARLKANHDVFMPEMEKLCKASTDPKCLWVDLRPVWQGHSEYTTDGIHCTDAGGTATAEAFWKAMKDSNFFDIEVAAVPYTIAKNVPLSVLSQIAGNGNLTVSLSVDQPSNIILHLTTISGRDVLTAEQQTRSSGFQTVMFPIGTIAPGIYNCKVKAGHSAALSTLLVP